MRERKRAVVGAAVVATAALIGALVGTSATAETATQARGAAYGVRENVAKIQTTLVEAAAPPALTQHDRDTFVDTPIAKALRVEADACVEAGAPARLQKEMDRAEFLERGGNPSDPVAEPPRQVVQTDSNFPNENCVTPTGEQVPPDTNLKNCEALGATEAGLKCLATELWNARGYGYGVLVGSTTEIQAEAVARCRGIGQSPEFMTGAKYGPLAAVDNNPQRPNQPLSLGGVFKSAVVTFWETNWDPRTNQTTDGSNTVWVNGLHIITPAEDIVIAHAEATADCPQPPTPTPTVTVTITPPTPGPPTPPPGGFPRDITLKASKGILHYEKTLTLSGAVTPATEFETPRRCVENVQVTIRRDVVGPPQQFVDVGTVTTDSEGNFSFNFQADRSAQWLAFIDKDNPEDCALVASPPQSVLVRPLVTLKASSRFPRRGSTMTFLAAVAPCEGHVGTRVKLRREFEGRSVDQKWGRLDDNCQTTFPVKVNFRQAVFDVAWPRQDDDHQNGRSRPKAIRSRG